LKAIKLLKNVFLLMFLFTGHLISGQTQIGQDIDGEAAGDTFGRFVVELSSDGNIVASSATGNDGNGNNSGHIRVFENNNGNWIQIGQDIEGEQEGSATGVGGFLGANIALSANGSVLAYGTPASDVNGNDSGLVRVLENQNGNWIQIGQDIEGEIEDIGLGGSVALSDDGSIIAIGVDNITVDNPTFSGFVRVYENQNGNWIQIGQDINNESFDFICASSLSLSSNGQILAIATPLNDSDNGNFSGNVNIYRNSDNNWIQIGENIHGVDFEFFGSSIELSNDGSIIAIGAPNNFENGTDDNFGFVRVFENQNENWVQIGEDIIADEEEDEFGMSLDFSDDGQILAVGAPRNNESNPNGAGFVRVFRNQDNNWIQLGEDILGEAAVDFFGNAVSLSSDGNTLAVGAPFNDGNGSASGHVRVFDITDLLLSTEENIEVQFKLYPNPSSEKIHIDLQQNAILEKVNIYNTVGQLINTMKDTIIDVSDLSQGTYFVEIITNTGRVSKKLIIE